MRNILHNEVPGIQLSDEARRRMSGLEKEEGREMGNQIAKELLDVAMPFSTAFILITPFLNYEMSVDLTNYVWEKSLRLPRPSITYAQVDLIGSRLVSSNTIDHALLPLCLCLIICKNGLK